MSRKCWDVMNCPEERMKACPAFTQNKGQDCWTVTGTYCKGQVQGTMVEKYYECRQCTFYQFANRVRFGIRTRLFAGFVAVVALLILLGAIAFYQVKAVDRSYGELLENKAAAVYAAYNLQVEFQQCALSLRNYLITGDQDHLDRFKEGRAKLNDGLNEMGKMMARAEGGALLKKIEDALEKFDGYAQSGISQKGQGRAGELIAGTRNDNASFAGLNGAMNELIEFNRKLLRDGSKDNAARTSRGLTAVVIILAMAAVLALAVTLLYRAVELVGSAKASICSTLEPITTVLASALILGEAIVPIQVAGMFLILAGILLPNIRLLRLSKATA